VLNFLKLAVNRQINSSPDTENFTILHSICFLIIIEYVFFDLLLKTKRERLLKLECNFLSPLS